MSMNPELQGLYLFKSLIKDGCKWQGDVCSTKWGECLYFDDNIKDRVQETLSFYDEGSIYKIEGNAVWIT